LNIKLAGQLTGYEIDVFRDTEGEDEEDVNIDEFTDEIESWIIDELKALVVIQLKVFLNLQWKILLKELILKKKPYRRS
jgi:transcription termination/antitermination protein NusA